MTGRAWRTVCSPEGLMRHLSHKSKSMHRFQSKFILHQSWAGVCWCNPPYGTVIGRWVRKAYESSQAGATVVCLLPARCDTQWWHTYVLPYAEIRYLQGRLKFGGAKNSAPFPSAVVIFRPPSRT
jgi:DNA N-6-adenine-methyltransferase (Dam)